MFVTALAAVAVWAGLYAWQTPTPSYAGTVPPVALPEPVEVTLSAFPRPAPPVVDASIELRSGARPTTGTVVVELAGERRPDGPDRLAILDGVTAAALADVALPDATPAVLRFDAIPRGVHWIVGYRRGTSAQRRYSFRRELAFDAPTFPGERSIAVDLGTTPAVVLVELSAPRAERTWLPVTATLRRVGDPAWSAPPIPDTPRTFEPGNADLVFEFAPLGSDRYELTFVGFEPDARAVFELPSDELVVVTGAPSN